MQEHPNYDSARDDAHAYPRLRYLINEAYQRGYLRRTDCQFIQRMQLAGLSEPVMRELINAQITLNKNMRKQPQ